MLLASECEPSVRAVITDGLHVFPHAASKITFAHVPRARETRNFKPCGATSLCVVVLSLEGTAVYTCGVVERLTGCMTKYFGLLLLLAYTPVEVQGTKEKGKKKKKKKG